MGIGGVDSDVQQVLLAVERNASSTRQCCSRLCTASEPTAGLALAARPA
jgi:hypothetical protein